MNTPCQRCSESAIPYRNESTRRSLPGSNVSQEARTTVLIQMRDPEDTPTIKTHESRGQGMILRGIDPLADPRGVE